MIWPDLQRASDAAGAIARYLLGLPAAAVQKAARRADPLTRAGFESIVKGLTVELLGVTRGADHDAMKSVQYALDVNWPDFTEAKREQAIRAIARGLGGVPVVVVPKVTKTLADAGKDIVQATKRSSATTFKLPLAASFSTPDQKVVQHAAESQAHYIRNEYGKRSERYSAVARSIVSKGLEQGLDRFDIAKDLSVALDETSAKRSLGYWSVVASIYATRSRSWASLSGFAEAGIESYVWTSVLDEVTSDICRFLDGRIFNVGSAMARFDEVASSEDPEAVVELQPFVRRGKDEDGNVGLFVQKGGEQHPIARVERSAVGTKDERGEFSGGISNAEIEDLGISSPPAHGHCRSVLIPHFGRAQTAPAQVPNPNAAARPKPYQPENPGAYRKPGKIYTAEQLAELARGVRAGEVNTETLPPPEPPPKARDEAAETFKPSEHYTEDHGPRTFEVHNPAPPAPPPPPEPPEPPPKKKAGDFPEYDPATQAKVIEWLKKGTILPISSDTTASSLGFVDHPYQSLKETPAHGFVFPWSTEELAAGIEASKGAKKKTIQAKNVVQKTPFVDPKKLIKALEEPDTAFNEVKLVKYDGKLYAWNGGQKIIANDIVNAVASPEANAGDLKFKAKVIDIDAAFKKKPAAAPPPEPATPASTAPAALSAADKEKAEAAALKLLNGYPAKKVGGDFLINAFPANSKYVDDGGSGLVDWPFAKEDLLNAEAAGFGTLATKDKPIKFGLYDAQYQSADVPKASVGVMIVTDTAKTKEPIILVKLNGVIHVERGEAAAFAQYMLNVGESTVTKAPTDPSIVHATKLIDLDAYAAAGFPKPAKLAKPPRPPATPTPRPSPATPVIEPPPEPPKPKPLPVDAAVIMGTKTGGAKGSNEGGFYTGKDGVKRYVKFYDDPSQAWGEHLANNIYNDLGLTAANSNVARDADGKLIYASDIFEGGKTLKESGKVSHAQGREVARGFLADVLTGNWDAIGTGKDNAMILPDGRIARIDNGGSFLFRAKEGRKPPALLGQITEWDVFFSHKNTDYKETLAAGGIHGPEDMKDLCREGLAKIKGLRERSGGWAAYVNATAPGLSGTDREAVVKMLEQRTVLLEEKVAELLRPAPPALPPGAARYVAKKYSSVTPRAGLRIEDLPESKVIDDHYEKIDRSHPKVTTSGEKFADYIKRARESAKPLEDDGAARLAVQSFTGSGYHNIRDSEDGGLPNDRSEAILRGLKKSTPEPGTVFRAIRNLPLDVIEKHLRDEVIGLGKKGSATSSTSWMIDVSIDSFMGGRHDDDGRFGYKILYVINHKTGVPIEHISGIGTEHEVLLHRETKFKTTGLSRAAGTKRVLVIECEEITDADAAPPAEEPKKKRAPRKKKEPAS